MVAYEINAVKKPKTNKTSLTSTGPSQSSVVHGYGTEKMMKGSKSCL